MVAIWFAYDLRLGDRRLCVGRFGCCASETAETRGEARNGIGGNNMGTTMLDWGVVLAGIVAKLLSIVRKITVRFWVRRCSSILEVFHHT